MVDHGWLTAGMKIQRGRMQEVAEAVKRREDQNDLVQRLMAGYALPLWGRVTAWSCEEEHAVFAVCKVDTSPWARPWVHFIY